MPPKQNGSGEQVLDLSGGLEGDRDQAFQLRATDPVVTNVATPADFAAQFPQPLDPTEILGMCDEIRAYQYIPELFHAFKQESWREMTSLEFSSGVQYLSFADGECPEEYEHGGDNTTKTLKNIGAKKSLTISDIIHSAGVVSLAGIGINRILGGYASTEGQPGGTEMGTFVAERIVDLKDKEVRLGATLVLNGWDRLLVDGDATTFPLEFDGIQQLVTVANGAHWNTVSAAASGTFSGIDFDRFIAEGCAKPQTVFGHPTAIQELLSAYFQLGFQGSQVINVASGERIIPGFNFAGFVNTGIGRLEVVADTNFDRTAVTSPGFQSTLYPLRMRHNGDPFVYKRTQIPLAFQDLTPGCTAISFQIWAKTVLIIKQLCAQSMYTSIFTGQIVTTCPTIG